MNETTARAICWAGIAVIAAIVSLTAVVLAPYGTLGFTLVCGLALASTALAGLCVWATYRQM